MCEFFIVYDNMNKYSNKIRPDLFYLLEYVCTNCFFLIGARNKNKKLIKPKYKYVIVFVKNWTNLKMECKTDSDGLFSSESFFVAIFDKPLFFKLAGNVI